MVSLMATVKKASRHLNDMADTVLQLPTLSAFPQPLISCNAAAAQQLEQLAVSMTAILKGSAHHELCAEIQGDSRRVFNAVRALNQVSKRVGVAGHVSDHTQSGDDADGPEESGPHIPAELLEASFTPEHDDSTDTEESEEEEEEEEEEEGESSNS